MRILITGSTGFIGGSVGRFAAAGGHEVVGIARRSQADAGWPGAHFAADVAQADLAGVIREVAPDVVFHGAGTASVAASFASPVDDLRAATLTWANLLDSVRRSGLRPRVIFPSSAAVYGNPARLPVTEDMPALPISPYGFHKVACEVIAAEYRSCFALDVIVCRVFSVFGSAQRRLLVWEIYEQLVGSDPAVVLAGTGDEFRDYLHVDDLAAGVLSFAADRSLGTAGGPTTFNLASGTETRVADLARQMSRLAGVGKAVRCGGRVMSGNPTRWVASLAKTTAAIPGWTPRPIADGLVQCLSRWGMDARRTDGPEDGVHYER